MQQMTLTEALSEINLLNKKIATKKENILQHTTRVEHVTDPLEKDGGSVNFVKSELQAIEDLKTRLIKIRSAVLKANMENEIDIDGNKMTIAEWLTWKKEVAKDSMDFYSKAFQQTKLKLDRQESHPQVFKDEKTGEVKCIKVVANIDYPDYIKRHAKIDETYEKLDGKLSLKNATVTVQI